ncbi:LOW QUALITY PROTEIN: olfactory receptor 2AG1-like [Ursus americanus]|uniref:LOW QUALITY PROTEIN: olfactory receptor 2AG1-like n=1 Tax=Ursus americanus TaxID=9643 RepID=UPI001E67D243|nr:LOW QUALITY PROTEIN: olfactory receptor 2AG1-like [Ursus americanus]
MELWNFTLGNGFILVGILNDNGAPKLLCAPNAVPCVFALTSNGLLLLVITMDAWLHVPMYFLLSQLSLMDLIFAFVVTPKILADYLCGKNTISFEGCTFQMLVVLTLGAAKDLLLGLMAYYGYVAICHPLNYMVLMRPRICWLLITSWILAFLNGVIYTSYTMHVPFCMSQEIRHLFCEILSLLKLACVDTSIYVLMVYVIGVTFLVLTLAVILDSYTFVLIAVLHMSSGEGLQKALNTCSSHLTVVGMYYGAAMFMYIWPNSYHSPYHAIEDNILSVFYIFITPTLNPLIYSLRNKEVMEAFRRVLGRFTSIQRQ